MNRAPLWLATACVLTLTGGRPDAAWSSEPPATVAQGAPAQPAVDPVIAEVNGDKLGQQEFWQLCETALRVTPNGGTVGMQVLSDWIQTVLRAQEARRLNVYPTEAEVEARLAEVRRTAGTEEAFQSGLRKQGLTVEVLRRGVLEALVSERLFFRGITVTDAEIQEAFAEAKERLTIPERLEVSQMTLDTPQKLEKARKELTAGKSFAEVATAHSTDAFASHGGRVPFPLSPRIAPGGPVSPATLQAAAGLAPGQVSAPLKAGATWILVRLEKRLPAIPPKLEEQREMLRGTLLNRKAQSSGTLFRNQQVVTEALRRAEIKIHRPEYAGLVAILKNAAGQIIRPAPESAPPSSPK